MELSKDVSLKSPSILKDLSRQCMMCAGCKKPRSELGEVSMRRCSGCRTVMYCTVACQRDHWRRGHRQDCKEHSKTLAAVQKLTAGTNFTSDWEQWTCNSNVVLTRATVTLLKEKADELSKLGRRVTADSLAPKYCLFMEIDYQPGTRLPFKIGEYEMLAYDELSSMVKPEVGAWMQTLKAGNAGSASDAVVLVCAIVVNMIRIVRLRVDRGALRLPAPADRPRVPELISVLNTGYAGAGTTRVGASVQAPVTENLDALNAKINDDLKKYLRAAGDNLTMFVLNSLQMCANASQRLHKTHRVVVKASHDFSIGTIRVQSFYVEKLYFLLKQMCTALDPARQALLEAKDSNPVLKESRVQYPSNELFPVIFWFMHENKSVLQVQPLLIPLEGLGPRKTLVKCKADAKAMFENLKRISA